MSAPWLEELNPSQREAVTHGAGPLLVVAGAGTGKTKTLACRVAWLIEQGVPPARILLLTFTRRAAAEMIGRAARVTSEAAAREVWGGTFHAIANRLLRSYGRGVGLGPDFTIMDESDAADMMALSRTELGFAKGHRRFTGKETLVKIYSRTINAQQRLQEVLDKHFPWCREDAEGIAAVFNEYLARKRQANVLDYEDLLLYWKALASAPGVGDRVADLFDHILVDEYQDTNAIQSDILRAMRRTRPNIMAVGDDAQSIYSFRSATVRNMLDFPKHFPDTRVVALEQNYRSVQTILAASNAVMEQAKERYTKNLWSNRPAGQHPLLVTCIDETAQTDLVCRHVVEHLERGIGLMHQAVLFRAGHHSAHLEIELARRNIPFHKYGGLRFVESAHIKDLLAMLRILENPYDQISWFRVLQLLEGIGPRSARRIMDELGVRRADAPPDESTDAGTGAAVESPLSRLLGAPPKVPPAAADEFSALRSAVARCLGVLMASDGKLGQGEAPSLPAQVDCLRVFYQPLFERAYDNAAVRARDLEQLESIAAGYRSRERFITDLTLDPPSATSDLAGPPYLEEDYLVLSTIHSAKGCEWDVVHILHAADGMIPSDMSTGDKEGIDEERRLFYVALTRAKDWLYVYFPLRYYHRRNGLSDAHGYAQLTRFISAEVRNFFEHRIDPAVATIARDARLLDGQARIGILMPAEAQTDVPCGAIEPSVRHGDVDAALRSLWCS